eukprot:TRINITY_DN23772_c0_g1_i1.p1 TRINITY_DN23772_c0_g1~~TRINITY_DN23772_c0_g1_i1.p1  ORF type:complete len:281 (-),score=80.55 TRINITY_DN23772_c0_g1_i1:195-1037(-)
MGACAAKPAAVKVDANTEVEEETRDIEIPKPDPSEVKTLIVWNDYNFEPVRHDWGHDGHMDNEAGANAFKQVLQINKMALGFELSRQQCTAENVVGAIGQVGGTCDDNDWFVFYYTGHGDSMRDDDGDEADGSDEALCTVGADGHCGKDTYLRDDDFAEAISSSVNCEKILIIMDCCHSGTIVDLSKDVWAEKQVVVISGCTDAQCSTGTGQGGLMTLSLLEACQSLLDQQETDATFAQVFNSMLKIAEGKKAQYGVEQDITIHFKNLDVNATEWPLNPV